MGRRQSVFGGRSSSGYAYPGTSADGLLGFGDGGSLRGEDQNSLMSGNYEKFWAEHHIHKLADSGGYYKLHLCDSEGNHALYSYGFEDCRCLGSEDSGLPQLRDHWSIGSGQQSNFLSGYDRQSHDGSLKKQDQNLMTAGSHKNFVAAYHIHKLAGSGGY